MFLLLEYNEKESWSMDLFKMMKDAQGLQKSLSKAQEELKKVEVTGSASGGQVEIIMTGHGEIKDVRIKKEAVDPNNIEKLEALVLEAMRDANKRAVAVSKERLGKLAGGLNLPPL